MGGMYYACYDTALVPDDMSSDFDTQWRINEWLRTVDTDELPVFAGLPLLAPGLGDKEHAEFGTQRQLYAKSEPPVYAKRPEETVSKPLSIGEFADFASPPLMTSIPSDKEEEEAEEELSASFVDLTFSRQALEEQRKQVLDLLQKFIEDKRKKVLAVSRRLVNSQEEQGLAVLLWGFFEDQRREVLDFSWKLLLEGQAKAPFPFNAVEETDLLKALAITADSMVRVEVSGDQVGGEMTRGQWVQEFAEAIREQSYLSLSPFEYAMDLLEAIRPEKARPEAATATVSAMLFQGRKEDHRDNAKSQDEKQASTELQPTGYVHQPLNDATRQIRLITIHTEGPLTNIHCEMEIHELDKVEGQYVAVSYTWGETEKVVVIHVDGTELRVNFNCWYALSRLKAGRDSKNLYWIDALCIDQAHHAEKGVQVARMGRIYSSAFEVAAVVGEDTVEASMLDFMHHRLLADSRKRDGITNMIDWKGTVKQTHVRDWTEVTALSSLTDLRHALRFLQDLPYFNRLWTVQECKLARRLRLYFGRSCLSWPDMMQWLYQRRIPQSREERYMEAQIQESAKLFVMQVWPMPHVPTESLPELIVRFRRRKCFDVRDKVYGLVPLAVPGTWRPLDIQYDTALPHVLLDYIQVHTSDPLTLASGVSFRTTRLANGQMSVPSACYRSAISFSSFWHSIRILIHCFDAAMCGFRKDMATLLYPYTLAPGEQVEFDPLLFRYARVPVGPTGCLVQRVTHIHHRPVSLTLGREMRSSMVDTQDLTRDGDFNGTIHRWKAWGIPKTTQVGDMLVSLPTDPKRPLTLVCRRLSVDNDDVVVITGSAHLCDSSSDEKQTPDPCSDFCHDCELFLHPRMLLRWALLSIDDPNLEQTALCGFERPTCLDLLAADPGAYSFIRIKMKSRNSEPAPPLIAPNLPQRWLRTLLGKQAITKTAGTVSGASTTSSASPTLYSPPILADAVATPQWSNSGPSARESLTSCRGRPLQ